MFKNNTFENLELRLAQIRKEKAPELEKNEKNFDKDYKFFLDYIFGTNFLGVKKYISVYFQIEKIDNKKETDEKIFKNAVRKVVEDLMISNEEKELLLQKLFGLEQKKSFIKEKILTHSDINKDINYPILESLEQCGILTKEDLLNISIAYKGKKSFLEAIFVLSEDKRDIIKNHYFELNNTKSEKRIENFKEDFKEELKESKLITIYPRVLNFIGKNYIRLKLKNKVETKKEKLRRMFKIAFLRLYRLKYSGIDISDILSKIESLEDLDDFISLLIKFFEELKQNPSLSSDYVVLDEIDDLNELVTGAEENKEKTLFSEKNILKASSLVEKSEKKLNNGNLEELLSSDVRLVGKDFIKKEKTKGKLVKDSFLNKEKSWKVKPIQEPGIFSENVKQDDEEEDSEESKKDVDLNLLFEELKQKLFDIEEKKRKLFLEGKYDEIDEINDELIELIKKLEKLKVLLGIEE